MGTQQVKNLPSHTARSPVKSPSSSGGSGAIASSEMGLPSVTATRTPPSGKAHFAAAYRRASRSSAASASAHPRSLKYRRRVLQSGSAATRLMAATKPASYWPMTKS